MPRPGPCVLGLLRPGADGFASDWTTEPGDLHVHDYGFDDYGTEIIALDAAYDHRTDVRALNWETTHRKWTGNAWQLDFAALDTDVNHFLDRGYTVPIAAAALSIVLSDYDIAPLAAELAALASDHTGATRRDIGRVRARLQRLTAMPHSDPVETPRSE